MTRLVYKEYHLAIVPIPPRSFLYTCTCVHKHVSASYSSQLLATLSGHNLYCHCSIINVWFNCCVCLISQNPISDFVTRQVVRNFSPDQTVTPVSLPVNQGAFLPPGATITLAVVRAEVTSPAELAGGLGDAAAPAQLVIGEDVANPIVFFDQRSLSASVNDCKCKQ